MASKGKNITKEVVETVIKKFFLTSVGREIYWKNLRKFINGYIDAVRAYLDPEEILKPRLPKETHRKIRSVATLAYRKCLGVQTNEELDFFLLGFLVFDLRMQNVKLGTLKILKAWKPLAREFYKAGKHHVVIAGPRGDTICFEERTIGC